MELTGRTFRCLLDGIGVALVGVQEGIVMYQDIFIMVVITGAVSIGALVSMRIIGRKKRRTNLIREFR
jgi:hypothetical protein